MRSLDTFRDLSDVSAHVKSIEYCAHYVLPQYILVTHNIFYTCMLLLCTRSAIRLYSYRYVPPFPLNLISDDFYYVRHTTDNVIRKAMNILANAIWKEASKSITQSRYLSASPCKSTRSCHVTGSSCMVF